ncbi:MAG: hypothetical protein RL765_333, partial [Pseudomonadota bacterium]
LVNTRNANAYTGRQGLNSIIELAKFFSDKKKISNKQILFASTGVIGQPFPLAKVKGALPNLIEKLKRPIKLTWIKQALSIMTTDTFGKMSCAVVQTNKDFPEMPSIDGLEISTTSAGLYNTNRDDVSLFYFPDGAIFSAVYTKSSIRSVCIDWNIKANKKDIRALLVNTRNANAYTGRQGLNSIIELAKFFSDKKKISQKLRGLYLI